MKVGLNVPKQIGGKTFPAGCVIDLFEPEALALIASGEGAAVPDGTMARKKAYGVPGCIPPAGFSAQAPVNAGDSEKNKQQTQKKI